MKVVVITLLATFSIQLGYFLWKISADSLPQIGKADLKVAIKGFMTNGKWLLGLIATSVGWVLFIRATEIGAISLIQPLMSVGDLFLVTLAIVFLHERLSRREWFGLALTVAGATALAFDAEVSVPRAIDWFRGFGFLGAAGLTLAVLLVISKRSRRPEVVLALAVGICFGVGAVLTKLITADLTLHGDQHMSLSGFLFNPLLPFMIGANVLGIVLLQMAFQKGRAAIIIPVQLSIVNGLAVLGGSLALSESVSLYRLACIVMIVTGTGFLKAPEPDSLGHSAVSGTGSEGESDHLPVTVELESGRSEPGPGGFTEVEVRDGAERSIP